MNIYKTKDGAMRERTYWDMFNLLEDQRVEDMMTNIWLANKKRFTKARNNRGKMHTKCADNPIDVMLNIRFFREDLVKRKKNWKEYKQALEDSNYDVIKSHTNSIHFHESFSDNSETIRKLRKEGLSFKSGDKKTGTPVRIPGDDRETWIRLSVGPDIDKIIGNII